MQERTPAEVVRLVADEGIEVVDLRFCDLPGLMQHFSIPAHALTEDREECLRFGCDDYLPKPIDWPRLTGLISSYGPHVPASP